MQQQIHSTTGINALWKDRSYNCEKTSNWIKVLFSLIHYILSAQKQKVCEVFVFAKTGSLDSMFLFIYLFKYINMSAKCHATNMLWRYFFNSRNRKESQSYIPKGPAENLS